VFPGVPGETDAALIALQRRRWHPVVEWARARYGPINVATDLVIKPHPHETRERVRSELAALDAWRLTAVESLTAGCKSVLLPLALYHRRISVKDAVQAARVEEEHQIQQWGLVEGGHDVERAHTVAQVSAASLFLWMLGGKRA
jgi:ATP synthase F1 complex assembly factor 2